jgi:hypothetical protein
MCHIGRKGQNPDTTVFIWALGFTQPPMLQQAPRHEALK